MGKIGGSSGAKREGGKANSLPPGAKLDYKEDVNRMYAKAKKAADERVAASDAFIAENEDLIDAIDGILVEQRRVFNSIGITLGGPNPIVQNLNDKLSGIDEFAELAREHEKKICDGLGLTPAEGWDMALAVAEAASGGKNTMGELSSIISNGAARSKRHRSRPASTKETPKETAKGDVPPKKGKVKVRRLKI